MSIGQVEERQVLQHRHMNHTHVQEVNCLGACALGPVVVLDGKYHGTMTSAKVKSLLKNI